MLFAVTGRMQDGNKRNGGYGEVESSVIVRGIPWQFERRPLGKEELSSEVIVCNHWLRYIQTSGIVDECLAIL